MGFARQIRLEIRNILKSRFLFVMAILALIASLAVPGLSYLNRRPEQNFNDYPYEKAMAVSASTYARGIDGYAPEGPYYGGKGQPITINGVTIGVENPLYWNLQNLMSERDEISKGNRKFSAPSALDMTLQLIEAELAYYLPFAQHITTQRDYRMGLVYRGVQSVHDRFFLMNSDKDVKLLEEVASGRKQGDPSTIKAKYIDITSEKRLAGIDAAETQMTELTSIVASNDFPRYIALEMKLAKSEIATLEENIALQEQTIIRNPAQEAALSQVIADTRHQIESIRTGRIPTLEYRLAKNIVPGLDIWQNSALNDVEQSRNQLAFLTIPTEEEWHKNQGMYSSKMAAQGQTYRQAVAEVQNQIDVLNKTVIVAQKSLDAGRPDIKYVPGGARKRTVDFLQYTAIVTLYGVLLGGWLIASEHQQGTIRLLMIRPRTRTKILLAKFTAAVVVWLAVDLIGSLLNLLANGVLFGFADFANPSYTVAGQTGFLAYYVPKLLACVTPTLFAFTFAFMLSVVSRNIAVSIIVPIVLYIVSVIAQAFVGLQFTSSWLAYTPIPYMQMATLLSLQGGMFEVVARRNFVSLTYGILLLLGLSALLTGISVLVFKKRDIVN